MVKKTDKPWLADDGSAHTTKAEAKAHDEEVAREKAWEALREWFEASISDSSDSAGQSSYVIVQQINADRGRFREMVNAVLPPVKRPRKPKAAELSPLRKAGAKVAAE